MPRLAITWLDRNQRVYVLSAFPIKRSHSAAHFAVTMWSKLCQAPGTPVIGSAFIAGSRRGLRSKWPRKWGLARECIQCQNLTFNA